MRKPQVSPQPQVPSESSKSKATAKLEEARMELQAELGKKAKAIEAGRTWGCMVWSPVVLGVALVCHCHRSSPHFESKELLPRLPHPNPGRYDERE